MVQLKQIVFTKPYTAEFLNVGEINLSKIEEKSVAVKTVVSTISAGHGTREPDRGRSCFDR